MTSGSSKWQGKARSKKIESEWWNFKRGPHGKYNWWNDMRDWHRTRKETTSVFRPSKGKDRK